ncbi:MAG: DNA mismatch repair protein MutS [Prevotellaceae bacterium]|jgi:dsDNA-specific endonuclease/ATPase MutS2|nr:DNA mismatch repair protein MutS [Prevotellaceae bacterium]
MTSNSHNITALRKSTNDNFGFFYLINKLDLKSSLSKRYLYSQKFITDKNEIESELNKIEETISLLDKPQNNKIFSDVENKLSQALDICGTLQNLANSIILSDIELFEIKKFAIIADDVKQLLHELNLIDLPDLSDAINILDPEKMRIATFYVCDAYSEELAALRKSFKVKTENQSPELYQKIIEIEDEIRKQLCEKLQPYTQDLNTALSKIAYLDILIAKAKQARDEHFCKPRIGDKNTSYKALFNPQIKYLLHRQGKKYQSVDISFGQYPTLITGINMGGKTVLLKTLALSQYLCQYGFYVPAAEAEIALVDEIMICMDDEQNHLQGLSSFAAEMKNIDKILSEINTRKPLLVLIDELARTTNPAEGSAIVNAMLDILCERNVCSFITTHYDKITSDCRRLRVRGLVDTNDFINEKNIEQHIDYSLVEETQANVPHEAIRIAEILGVNDELITGAKNKIKK